MWAFERVIGATLRGFNDIELKDVSSRLQCERLCLAEESFTCRSAKYDFVTSVCTLSREDRRSQPSAFVQVGGSVEYLENQCIPTSTSLYGCLYKTRRDIAVVSRDGSRSATSETECQTFCYQSTFFLCRSYTYIADQRICLLSSDDTLSFPRTEPRLGSYYGQLKCTINQCTAGIITFEKVSGFTLQSARQEILGTVSSSGNTAGCLNQCLTMGSTCPAVVIDYIHSACYRLDRNSQGRDTDLVSTSDSGYSYFEQVCLQGKTQKCNDRLWAFERVLNHEIRGADDVILSYIQSRRECEEKCLQEAGFVCRSAEYDYESITCTLSRKDRRTSSAYFVPTTRKVDYLENQCIDVPQDDEEDEICEYVSKSDGFPRFTDAVISETDSIESCKNSCSVQKSFTCRGLGFRRSTRECYLSGDDSISVGSQAAAIPSDGITYYERQCDIAVDTATPEQPITHPFPFTPPTQEPIPGPEPNPPGRCRGSLGRTEYEKTTGYKVSEQLFPLYDGGIQLGITVECHLKCNSDPNCQGIVLDYGNNRCYALKNDPPLNRDIFQRAQSTAYFEPVCYQMASGCSKLWTFERFLRKQLKVKAADVIRGLSKVDCQQRCLVSTRFICRSFNYDVVHQECHLNTEDTSTKSQFLANSVNFDYYENQCYLYSQLTRLNSNVTIGGRPVVNDPRSIHETKVPTTNEPLTSTTKIPAPQLQRFSRNSGGERSTGVCRYTNVETSSRLTYIERGVDVNAETDCQMACEKEFLFNCKSYSFVLMDFNSDAKCYLSADTKNSVGAEIRTMARSIYVERVCDPNFVPPSPPITTTPLPKPPYPPKPKPLPPPPYYPPDKPDYDSYNPESPLHPPHLPPPPPPPHPPPPPPDYYSYGSDISYGDGFSEPHPDSSNPYFHNPYSPGQIGPHPPPPSPHDPTQPIGHVRTSLEDEGKAASYGPPAGSHIFPLPGSPTNVGPTACYSGVTFERITKLANQGFGSDIRISLQQQPSIDCLQECLVFGDQCQTITFKSISQCTLYGTSLGKGLSPLVVAPDSTYFQKICLAGSNCDKAWAFDRVPFYYLDGYDDIELQNYNTREACELACLRQTTFPCRSADYFYSKSVCRLSRETRRSQPFSFQYYGDGVEYLENQCQPEPGFCGFMDYTDRFLPYFDKKLFGIVNQFDCQNLCIRERAFICRSITFDHHIKECYLSSCDRHCGFDIVIRLDTVYSEVIPCTHGFQPPPPRSSQHPPNLLRHFPAPPYQDSNQNNHFVQSSSSYDFTARGCQPPTHMSFERTNGYAPLTVHHHMIPTTKMNGATETCVKKCAEMALDCMAFVIVYLPAPTSPECLIYGQHSDYKLSVPESGQLQNKADVTFFEKICLRDPGFACDMIWTFDRIFGYEFSSGFFMTYEAVTSRKECEDLCLRYSNFPCRSASYSFYMKTCKLNVESRQTRIEDFHYVGGDVQYLENQCTAHL
ncbi:hypothetical protein CHUAL_005456 [Chamberlinius hualienensis]